MLCQLAQDQEACQAFMDYLLKIKILYQTPFMRKKR